MKLNSGNPIIPGGTTQDCEAMQLLPAEFNHDSSLWLCPQSQKEKQNEEEQEQADGKKSFGSFCKQLNNNNNNNEQQ